MPPLSGADGYHVLILPSWYPAPHAPINGVYVREQAQALSRAGHRVGVCYPERRNPRTPFHPGTPVTRNRFQLAVAEEDGLATVRRLGWAIIGLHRLQGRAWVAQAEGLVRRYIERFGRPDLVHAHVMLWGGIAAARLRERLALPFVVTEHSTGYARGLMRAWHRPHLERACKEAAALLAVSPALAEAVGDYAGGREVEVVPNLVDTNTFHLPDSRPPPAPFRWLSVGTLVPKKGMDVLLRAFAQTLEEGPAAELEIIGEGPERAALEALAAELGIAERVHFAGLLDRAEVAAAMRAAHGFALASHVETFGIVAAEALASGLDVVATRCGGPESFVEPDRGRIVPAGDAAALAAAMRATAAAPSPPERRTALRQAVIESFGEAALCRNLGAVYARVLA